MLSGMTSLVPLDDEIAEKYMMFQFMRAFNCSPQEYEALPYKESQWLLQIDRVYKEAEQEASERARK